jgi:hypothetical protein
MSRGLGYAAVTGKRPNIPINPKFLSLLPENAVILDLGCGARDHAKALANLGHTVYACDPGIGVVAEALERSIEVFDSGGKIIFFNATAETMAEELKKLPSKPQNFDAVWMEYSLPFVSDAGVAFNDISHHLKTDGIFYTSFFEPDPSIAATPELTTYTPEQIAGLFEENKLPFKIQVCQLLPPSPPKKIIQGDGGFAYIKSGVQNPATILISTKKAEFSASMNLDNGQLRIKKIGSHKIEAAIFDAARTGDIKKLNLFIKTYQLEAKYILDEYNGTLLHHAAHNGQIDMFRHLVDIYQLDPDSSSNSGGVFK